MKLLKHLAFLLFILPCLAFTPTQALSSALQATKPSGVSNDSPVKSAINDTVSLQVSNFTATDSANASNRWAVRTFFDLLEHPARVLSSVFDMRYIVRNLGRAANRAVVEISRGLEWIFAGHRLAIEPTRTQARTLTSSLSPALPSTLTALNPENLPASIDELLFAIRQANQLELDQNSAGLVILVGLSIAVYLFSIWKYPTARCMAARGLRRVKSVYDTAVIYKGQKAQPGLELRDVPGSACNSSFEYTFTLDCTLGVEYTCNLDFKVLVYNNVEVFSAWMDPEHLWTDPEYARELAALTGPVGHILELDSPTAACARPLADDPYADGCDSDAYLDPAGPASPLSTPATAYDPMEDKIACRLAPDASDTPPAQPQLELCELRARAHTSGVTSTDPVDFYRTYLNEHQLPSCRCVPLKDLSSSDQASFILQSYTLVFDLSKTIAWSCSWLQDIMGGLDVLAGFEQRYVRSEQRRASGMKGRIESFERRSWAAFEGRLGISYSALKTEVAKVAFLDATGTFDQRDGLVNHRRTARTAGYIEKGLELRGELNAGIVEEALAILEEYEYTSRSLQKA